MSALDTRTVAGISNNDNGGGLSWILIAVGGLLVALGIGAIVLLFVRKKDDDDPADDRTANPRRGPQGPPGPPGGGGGPRPGQRWNSPPEPTQPMRGGPGGHDQTRPLRPPVSPGPRGDQTMIAPSPLVNAPTQLHARVPDPDPYGAPRHGGAAPGMHGGGPSVFGQGQYGQPGQPSGYGSQPPPGYGAGPATVAYPGGAPAPYGPGGAGPAGYAAPYGAGAGAGVSPDPYAAPGYGPAGGPPAGGPTLGMPPQVGQPGGAPFDPRTQRPMSPPPPPPSVETRRVDWVDD